MSFFTSVVFYRPCKPPQITANDIARFIVALRDERLVEDTGFQLLQVKFGSAVDQDENPTSWEEKVARGMSILRSIDWDLDLKNPASMQNMIDTLSGDNRNVYRASVSVGLACDAILAPITRTNSPENEIDYYPAEVSLQIGPTELYLLGSDERALVGWLGVCISGSGYFYPWTFQDVFERLNASADIHRLAAICRSTWPVPETKPEPHIIEARQQLGEMWPYDQFDKKWDLYWGPAES